MYNGCLIVQTTYFKGHRPNVKMIRYPRFPILVFKCYVYFAFLSLRHSQLSFSGNQTVAFILLMAPSGLYNAPIALKKQNQPKSQASQMMIDVNTMSRTVAMKGWMKPTSSYVFYLFMF